MTETSVTAGNPTASSQSSNSQPSVRAAASAIERGTERLLTHRRPAWPLAFMRILFGIVLFGWTATMAFDAKELLGSDAIIPIRFATQGRWNWFGLETTGAVWVALAALAFASIAIIVGWRPTRWLVLSFLLLVAIQRRNPVILNSGDLLIRNLALLLAFTPTSAALSVDRWRRHGRHALRTAPLIAPWGLRLIQLQLMVVYFIAFWSKSGNLWLNGTAVSTAFRLEDLQRISTPSWIIENVIIIAVLTWGALAVELSLATLLWVKKLRPVLIALAVSLHLFIDIFILVGFFGPLMITALLSFTDADWIDRKIAHRFGMVRQNPDGALADATQAQANIETSTNDRVDQTEPTNPVSTLLE
jgi:hypothetical protein